MKPSRKRRDGIQRQSQIMKIALELFSKKGFHETKLEEILKKAHIAKGTFYLHFDSKDDLLHMLVDHHLDELYNVLKVLDISMDKPVDDLITLYVTIARKLINDERFRMIARIMFRDAIGVDIKLLEKLNTFYNKIISMSAEYIQKAQDKGRVIPTLDPFFTSVCIVGSVKELVFQWAVNNESLDLEKGISTAVSIYFRGMIIE